MSTAFVVLLLAGLFLIAAEVFVPGGVIGSVGALCLLTAIVMAFLSFPVHVAILMTVGIVILLGIILAAWIRFFPRTRVGRGLTLDQNGRTFKATKPGLRHLVGKEGVTQSPLRPAGIAKIDGQRVDVIAESDWVEAHTPIRVVRVEGNRVIVRKAASAASGSAEGAA